MRYRSDPNTAFQPSGISNGLPGHVLTMSSLVLPGMPEASLPLSCHVCTTLSLNSVSTRSSSHNLKLSVGGLANVRYVACEGCWASTTALRDTM